MDDDDTVTLADATGILAKRVFPVERELRSICDRLSQRWSAVYDLTPHEVEVLVAGGRLARAVVCISRNEYFKEHPNG